MLTQIRNKIVMAVSLLLLAAVPMMAPVSVYADTIQNSVCDGVNRALGDDTGDCTGTSGEEKVNGIITDVVNLFSIIVGVVAVIMIIYGGFRYITSGGDSGKITNAKNTIIYALIGLIIVALAQFIVKFVLEKVNSGA